MANSGSTVFPNFTGWIGNTFVTEGEPWAADDPFVRANPRHFRDNAGDQLRRTAVEQATAAPGEKRTTSTGRKTSQ